MINEPKFLIGDRVRVVNYGGLAWHSVKDWKRMFDQKSVSDETPPNLLKEQEDLYVYDINPSIVGKEGVVREVDLTQGKFKYALDGIAGKSAWYDDQQLEKID